MHKTSSIVLIAASCIAILLSCFLPWTHNPTYSLFTIADYAGSYGRYISEIRFLSIAAFLLPLGASLALVSIAFERFCRIISIIVGIYSLIFATGTLMLVFVASDKLPTPVFTAGPYLCLLASIVLIVTGIRGKNTQ